MPDSEHDFGRLYAEYQSRIRRYVAPLVGEPDAEDLTQTVFLKASQALKDFRGRICPLDLDLPNRHQYCGGLDAQLFFQAGNPVGTPG